MPARLLSIADVARESGVPRHRVVYALTTGRLKEPRRLQNRRCFTPQDLEQVKRHFSETGGSRRS
jgi:DNA-binding transcriptional MerR regulator